jgi:hypothetical protein
MMAETGAYASYLVRIWQEPERADAPEATGWAAEVESIQSGDSWHFADVSSLITFIERASRALMEGGDA